ncbi:hypothetical protein GQ54DRAFT_308805 [Martensiomyces pterosporus]|nr:hypothetical protein GQ54DRAFT_308805 [Martensiomyces pterosporus]
MASYFIEVLDNLSVVDIYVECKGGGDPGFGCCAVKLEGSQAVRVDRQTAVGLPVPVDERHATTTQPTRQTPKGGPAVESQEWVRIRAPIASGSKMARLETSPRLITDVKRPITARMIDGLHGIRCRNCKEHILETDHGGKHSTGMANVRDLPSTYWSELIDCWVCHPEEDELNINMDLLHIFEPECATGSSQTGSSKANSTQKTDPENDGVPSSGTSRASLDVWVGHTHILAPQQLFRAVVARNVTLDAKDRFHGSYMELQCNECESAVGEVGYMGQKKLFMVYSHRVDFLLKDPSLAQTFASEVVDHAAAHAIYKFIVEDRRLCKPVLLVHLVGWNAEIIAHAPAARSKPVSGRCIKVLYAEAGGSTFDTMAKHTLFTYS